MSNDPVIQWKEVYSRIESNPDELEFWEDLIDFVEGDKFKLSRASDERVVGLFRFSFDGLLERYPLLFGYWIRYSELEFRLGNTELAWEIYERAVGCCPYSVDLWISYCKFCIKTFVKDQTRVRLIFERAIELVGGHFLSDGLWDLYLEYEETLGSEKEVIYKILGYIIKLPIHQYSKYFARYRALTPNVSVELTAPKEVIEQFKAEFELEEEEEREYERNGYERGGREERDGRGEYKEGRDMDIDQEDLDLYGDEYNEEKREDKREVRQDERRNQRDNQHDHKTRARSTSPKPSIPFRTPADLRIRITNYHRQLYKQIQIEVTKRYQYEAIINRHYFDVTFIEENQRVNWNKYLDFEEIEGDEDKIILLYERALIPLGHDEILWFRYVRWLIGKGKLDDSINTLYRASKILPIGRPDIRYYLAIILASNDMIYEARELIVSILDNLPFSIKGNELLISLIVKSEGINKGIEHLEDHLKHLETLRKNPAENDHNELTDYMVSIIKQLADLYIKTEQIPKVRELYEKFSLIFSKSIRLWKNYLEFEIAIDDTPGYLDTPTSALLLNIQTSDLDKSQIKYLTQIYSSYLLNTKSNSAKQYLRLDR